MTLFRTKPKEIPKTSTDTSPPTYTTLTAFQKVINENAISVPSNTSDLGHLVLVISNVYFLTENRSYFGTPACPKDKPNKPRVGKDHEMCLFKAQHRKTYVCSLIG